MSEQYPDHTLYKPQNQKECDRVAELILENQNPRKCWTAQKNERGMGKA